jgi:hypothetical protein
MKIGKRSTEHPNEDKHSTQVTATIALAILITGLFAVTSFAPAHAVSTSNVSVQTYDEKTGWIFGYYVTLWQGGAMVNSCYSTCAFRVQNGVEYQIAVSDYGNECFNHWEGPGQAADNTSRFQDIYYSSSTSVILDAYFTSCSSTTGPGMSQLTVTSQDSSGNALTGYYTALFQGGSEVATGYTTAHYALNNGQTYTIQADSYGNCIFQSWSGGLGTSASTTISITSDTTITAVYDCGGTSSSGSSLTVNSQDQNGNPIFGYYDVLWSSGSVVATGYTTNTFPTSAGQSYSLQVDDYGSCTFAHWADGSTANPRAFTASSGAQSFTAVYACG